MQENNYDELVSKFLSLPTKIRMCIKYIGMFNNIINIINCETILIQPQ